MKTTTFLLFLLQLLFLSCIGQKNKNTYTQKLEYALKGPVKKVTTCIQSAENGKIPTDTINYAGKTSMTFDRLGNMLVMHRLWKADTTGKSKRRKTEFTMQFSGQGKDISFKDSYRLEDGDLEETGGGTYVWSDDYHYTIVPSRESSYRNVVALDKEYRLLNTAFMENDSLQTIEELEFIYKNNKLQERKSKITENKDGKTEVSYRIQVVQQSDQYGNPTLIYGYSDMDKQKITEVLYKEYQYYE
ncbi:MULTISPECIES: hypothetical protein [Chryseobacterium]|uniref:hypothetical protein n=1 Tax=Chryseobacterium sp. R2A-55 TaxID=2744445 RepID=UPI001F280E88|nr:hypothetical protein [Chryseobacterium sp. R2A-55]